MDNLLATGFVTITDLSDPIVSSTAPPSPVEDMIWMDISVTPPVLKIFRNGQWEAVSSSDVEGVLPDTAPVGGYFNGDLIINKNYSGIADNGEIQVTQGLFIHPNGGKFTIPAGKQIYTDLENNLGRYRYIMFIGHDSSRFEFVDNYASRHFVITTYKDRKWFYFVNDNTAREFEINDNDCIVAKITETTESQGGNNISKIIKYYEDEDSVFQALTNGGEIQGIYKKDGLLFVNAEYIATGKLTSQNGAAEFDLDKGTFRLGGTSSTDYKLKFDGTDLYLGDGSIKWENLDDSSKDNLRNMSIYILGGVRNVVVNANNEIQTNPTVYQAKVMLGLDDITKSCTLSWTAAGIYTGTSSGSLFTPEKGSYTNGESYVEVKATYKGIEIKERIGISVSKQGQQGDKGDKGEQGVPGVQGPSGADGKTYYTWVKYADDAQGNGMSDLPDGKKYIGMAYNKPTSTESSVASDYSWSLIQGPQGLQGPAGTDGKTTYTWLKYADTPTSGMSDDPTGKKYMGLAYNKTTQTESTNYSDYTWSLIKGEDGRDGATGPQGPQGPQGIQGPAGADGKTTYTWIKYADTPTSGMSDLPDGKTYMGIAYNKTTSVESTSYSDYSWSLIKGSDGVRGPAGTDGKTYYTWIKYADTPTSGMSDSPDGKKYMGIAYNKTTQTESTNYSDYAWSLIKGSDGATGPQGPQGVSITKVDVEYAIHTSATTAPTSGWQTTSPTWVDGKYIWSRTKTTYSSGTSTYSQAACITGGKGATGSQGATGSAGTGVETITEEYYLSTSKTTQTGGSWVTSPPTWSYGKYMWTRSKIVYKNPTSTVYTPAVCDTSWEAVNEIEIGGRNYVLNSALKENSNNFSLKAGVSRVATKFTPNNNPCFYIERSGLTTNAWSSAYQYITGLQVSKTYTASCNAFLPTGHGIDAGATLEVVCFNASNSRTGTFYKTISLTKLDIWQKYEVTFTVPSDTVKILLQPYIVKNGKMYVGDYSLVEGSKGIWVQAPEDIEKQISDVSSKVDEIEIGGRNIYLRTKEINRNDWGNIDIWSTSEVYNGFTVFSRNGSWGGLYQKNIELIDGKHYVVSAYVKGDGIAKINAYVNEVGTIKYNFVQNSVAPTEWTRLWFTFRQSGQTNLKPRFENSVDGANLKLYGFKLEEGNKPTDWTPAPEDTDEAIGNTVKSVATLYYSSTSSTTQTGGSWVTTMPAISSGKYIWTKTRTTLVNGTIVDSTPILYQLDWIQEWGGTKTEIGGTYIISPKIFAGTKNSSGQPTGVAIGSNIFGTGTGYSGLFGYKNGVKTFHLGTDGNILVGQSTSGNHLSFDGTTLSIKASNISIQGNDVVQSISNAQSAASTANSAASKAQSTANTANSAASAAQTAANKAQSTADSKLDPTQTAVFNALTNNGQTQGIYLQNGKIYINGEYIKANSIKADMIAVDAIKGKTISGGTIKGATISGNTISGNTISGGTITGSTITGSTIVSEKTDTSNTVRLARMESGRFYCKTSYNGISKDLFIDGDEIYLSDTTVSSSNFSTAISTIGLTVQNIYNANTSRMSVEVSAAGIIVEDDPAYVSGIGSATRTAILYNSVSTPLVSLSNAGNAKFGYQDSSGDVYIANKNNNWLRLKTDNSMTYAGKSVLINQGRQQLWSGGLYMTNTQTATPTKTLGSCQNGWVLVWCDYNDGAAADYNYMYQFIHKNSNLSGKNSLWVTSSGEGGVTTFTKGLYIHNDRIVGHARNSEATGWGNDIVLRYIFEW